MPNIKYLLVIVCAAITFSIVPVRCSESKEHISTTLVFKTKPRVALALAGGGCKCVAEIGVLRILEANKIPIDYIVGTSTGATIGAMYASGMSVNEIERLYRDGVVQKAMIPRLAPRIIMFPLAQIKRNLTDKGYAGIINGSRFERYLAKILPAQFADLKIPFSTVSTDLISGQTVVFSEGYLPIAVQASNSLPPMFKPVSVDGKLLVDGALRANVPAKWARSSGADVVIAVDVDPSIKIENVNKFASLKNLLLRVSDITVSELDTRQGTEADVVIRPDTNGVKIMTDKKGMLEKTIKNGEQAATQALPQIMSALQAHSIATTK